MKRLRRRRKRLNCRGKFIFLILRHRFTRISLIYFLFIENFEFFEHYKGVKAEIEGKSGDKNKKVVAAGKSSRNILKIKAQSWAGVNRYRLGIIVDGWNMIDLLIYLLIFNKNLPIYLYILTANFLSCEGMRY